MEGAGTTQDCFELLIKHGFKREQLLFAKIVDCIKFYLTLNETPVELFETYPTGSDAGQNTPEREKLEEGEVELDLKAEVVEKDAQLDIGKRKIHKKRKTMKIEYDSTKGKMNTNYDKKTPS